MPESTLLAANEYLINVAPATGGGGNFGPGIGFSPVVDGDYIPDLPSILLQQGRFHKSVESLIVGNMKEEVGHPPLCFAVHLDRSKFVLN